MLEEDGCPLFSQGDEMVLDLPEVDLTSSRKVCALTIAKFLEGLDKSPCEGLSAPVGDGELLCPRASRPVRFEVEAVDEERKVSAPEGDLVRDITAAVAHLRSIPIFRPLPAAFLSRLAHRIRTESKEDGELILQKGHPGDAFFVVREGKVEVMDFADTKMASVVTTLKAGDCFGEMSILTGAPVAANVRARGHVELYALSKEDFEHLLRDNPFMAARFTRLMAQRLVAANFRIVQEGKKSFSGKLAVMNIPTVVQVLADARRSGTLVVEGYDRRRGEVAFSDGDVFDAHLDSLTGEEAVYALLAWQEGDFAFDPGRVPTEDKVKSGVMNLLLEGMRRIDEAERDESAS